jgi:hypothetical protein
MLLAKYSLPLLRAVMVEQRDKSQAYNPWNRSLDHAELRKTRTTTWDVFSRNIKRSRSGSASVNVMEEVVLFYAVVVVVGLTELISLTLPVVLQRMNGTDSVCVTEITNG